MKYLVDQTVQKQATEVDRFALTYSNEDYHYLHDTIQMLVSPVSPFELLYEESQKNNPRTLLSAPSYIW